MVSTRMRLEPIRVETVADPWAGERPSRLESEGQWIEVVEVLDRWYQVESLPEWPKADYFKAMDGTGRLYLVKHDREADEWFLGRCWPKREAAWPCSDD